MPCLVDPNHPEGEIKLWESGAIIEYLIDVYDTEGKLSYSGFPERYQQNCWKHFQMSGQGPYFGQLNWFKFVSFSQFPVLALPVLYCPFIGLVRLSVNVAEHGRIEMKSLLGQTIIFERCPAKPFVLPDSTPGV